MPIAESLHVQLLLGTASHVGLASRADNIAQTGKQRRECAARSGKVGGLLLKDVLLNSYDRQKPCRILSQFCYCGV